MSEFLTTEEAAALIKMQPDYVARQCKAGQIKAKKLGTTWRIRRADLDAFMAGGMAPATRDRSKDLTVRQQKRAS